MKDISRNIFNKLFGRFKQTLNTCLSLLFIVIVIISLNNLPLYIYIHYNYIGLSYAVKNNYIGAERAYKKSFLICNKFFGEKNAYTIRSMEDLGNIYLRYGNYNESQKIFEKAYKLRCDNSLLSNSFLYERNGIYLLNNLADLYEKQGNYTKAEKLYRQTLTINNKIYGKESDDSLASLLNISEICLRQNHLNQAKLVIDEIKKFPKIKQGPKNQFYYGVMHETGRYYQSIKSFHNAESIFKESIKNGKSSIYYRKDKDIKPVAK